jgi:hypothetical protein
VLAFILYVIVLLLAAVPGLPAGWRLFGRRHPAGWIAGALLGYALTAVAIWAAIRAGVPSTAGFVVAWCVVSLAAWVFLGARGEPAFPFEPWTRQDTIALSLVLLLTAVVAAPPFLKLGSRDAAGNRYYRAYFTADFVWHTALTAEVAKFSMPPRNPFLRNRAIHYYWAYFLLPAAVSSSGPAPLRDVERCLKLNAFFCGLLFISAIFMSVRAAVPSAAAAGVSTALALVASSAEGMSEVIRLARDGIPWASLRETNIDAITAWRWQGYRVDGLQRAIWYNPQHSMAGALGLIGMAAAARGSAATPLGGLLAGLALGGSVAMNPFVGAMFSMAYGVGTVLHAWGTDRPVRRILYGALAVVPVLGALAWCSFNEMVEGAGGNIDFGFHSISRHSPLVTLLLSLGPALLPAVAGLLVRGGVPFRPLAPAAALASVSVFLMYYMRIAVDEYWVGFRTGHLLLVSLPVLSASFFLTAWRRARPAAIAVGLAAFLAGVPTLLIDAYNAQDTRNFIMSVGGFPWTRQVTTDEQAAWRWIREETPVEAVVQQDVLSRHPNSWWVVPTFGHRRLAAAIPPFLMFEEEYMEKSRRVQTMYATGSAEEAWTIARSLRIDYVYVDAVERQAYGPALDKFADEKYFSLVFQNAAASIYAVK